MVLIKLGRNKNQLLNMYSRDRIQNTYNWIELNFFSNPHLNALPFYFLYAHTVPILEWNKKNYPVIILDPFSCIYYDILCKEIEKSMKRNSRGCKKRSVSAYYLLFIYSYPSIYETYLVKQKKAKRNKKDTHKTLINDKKHLDRIGKIILLNKGKYWKVLLRFFPLANGCAISFICTL